MAGLRRAKYYSMILWIFVLVCAVATTGRDSAEVIGIFVEGTEYVQITKDRISVTEDRLIHLRLFGRTFTNYTTVAFTTSNFPECYQDHITHAKIESVASDGQSVRVGVKLSVPNKAWYICTSVRNNTGEFVHQGNSDWLTLRVHEKPASKDDKPLIPLWLQIVLVVILLLFSGLFSGLNLGLMALDKTELAIVATCGSEKEIAYAKSIAPLRERGNFLLCTLLLGNVLVNSTLTIFMDSLAGTGLYAIIASTFGIVIFGEIIPQAVCSRHGLAVGAKTILLTKLFMILTFPIAYPISLLLDCVLGKEIGQVYGRERLQELIKVTNARTDLKQDEVNIISGALELSSKTVSDVMTRIEDVYMVEQTSMLDYNTMAEMIRTGYTRIPVFVQDNGAKKIEGLLNIKDLAFVDPDDKTPLRTVCKFYNHQVNFVFHDAKLDAMLEDFKKGHSHMAVVQRVNDMGEGDPFYETVGVVTLEDIIEEIIKSEILDETDTVTDNKYKRPRLMGNRLDFTCFSDPSDAKASLSPQLTLATFQYLSTSVGPFKSEFMSENVLRRLMQQDVVCNYKFSGDEEWLYTKGKPADYFILIVIGRVQVEIGKEQLVFEGGPFTCFGIQSLGAGFSLTKQASSSSLASTTDSVYSKGTPYIPDYYVKALSDLQYLKVYRGNYVAARRATQVERHPKTPASLVTEDPFTKEWTKATEARSRTKTALSQTGSTDSKDSGCRPNHDDNKDFSHSNSTGLMTSQPGSQTSLLPNDCNGETGFSCPVTKESPLVIDIPQEDPDETEHSARTPLMVKDVSSSSV